MGTSNPETVKKWLTEGKTIEVTFTKADGEKRTMRCTTNLKRVPAEKQPKGILNIQREDIKRVFDLDKADWRTVPFERLIDAKVVA